MKTKHEIRAATLAILSACKDLVPEHAQSIGLVNVKLSARMTQCAGKAFVRRHEIRISIPYFADDENFSNDLRDTVTHELAHLLAPPTRELGRRKRDVHGPAWRAMHRRLGGNGERCHTLELAEGYERRPRVESTCHKCNQPMILGPVQAKRHAKALADGQPGYTHKACGR